MFNDLPYEIWKFFFGKPAPRVISDEQLIKLFAPAFRSWAAYSQRVYVEPIVDDELRNLFMTEDYDGIKAWFVKRLLGMDYLPGVYEYCI